MHDRALSRLDHLSLNDMADYFEHQADMFRNQAVSTARSDIERTSAAVSYLINAPRVIMRYLRQGYTLEESINKAATTFKTPHDTIERTWRRFLYSKTIYDMKKRNTLILELACLGFTNSQIGKKVYLHPNSVSRIIAQSRKSYQTGKNINPDRIDLLLSGGMPDKSNSGIFG